MLSEWYRFFSHCLETLNATCYIPIVGTIINLRVYERHTSIAWAQMSLTLLSRVLVSDSNGDNKSGQEVLASGNDDVLFPTNCEWEVGMYPWWLSWPWQYYYHHSFITYLSLSHGLKTSVPERPITANPGLKCCCTILMYKFTFYALVRVTFCINAPAGISSRGEIPRRHPSNSRVY